MDPISNSWHLDKRVPVALIITLLIQFTAGVWFLSAAFKDIESNRNGIIATDNNFRRLEARQDLTEQYANQQAVQLGRIEEITTSTRDGLNRLIEIVDQRRGPPWSNRP